MTEEKKERATRGKDFLKNLTYFWENPDIVIEKMNQQKGSLVSFGFTQGEIEVLGCILNEVDNRDWGNLSYSDIECISLHILLFALRFGFSIEKSKEIVSTLSEYSIYNIYDGSKKQPFGTIKHNGKDMGNVVPHILEYYIKLALEGTEVNIYVFPDSIEIATKKEMAKPPLLGYSFINLNWILSTHYKDEDIFDRVKNDINHDKKINRMQIIDGMREILKELEKDYIEKQQIVSLTESDLKHISIDKASQAIIIGAHTFINFDSVCSFLKNITSKDKETKIKAGMGVIYGVVKFKSIYGEERIKQDKVLEYYNEFKESSEWDRRVFDVRGGKKEAITKSDCENAITILKECGFSKRIFLSKDGEIVVKD